MRRPITTALLAAALAGLGATPAQAAVCQAQPGQGAIDQYCEIIPSGAGDRPTRSGGSAGQGSPGSAGTGTAAAPGAGVNAAADRAAALPAGTQRALRSAGRDGEILTGLAATSPARRTGAAGAGGTGAAGAGATGSGPAGATGDAAREGATARELAAARGDVRPGGSSKSPVEALLSDPFGGPIGSAWVLWAALAVVVLTLTAAWRRRTGWT